MDAISRFIIVGIPVLLWYILLYFVYGCVEMVYWQIMSYWGVILMALITATSVFFSIRASEKNN